MRFKIYYVDQAKHWLDSQPPEKSAYVKRAFESLITDQPEVGVPIANDKFYSRQFGRARVFKTYAYAPGQRILYWIARQFGRVAAFRIKDRNDDPYGDGR